MEIIFLIYMPPDQDSQWRTLGYRGDGKALKLALSCLPFRIHHFLQNDPSSRTEYLGDKQFRVG
jgi:hypothetical protein